MRSRTCKLNSALLKAYIKHRRHIIEGNWKLFKVGFFVSLSWLENTSTTRREPFDSRCRNVHQMDQEGQAREAPVWSILKTYSLMGSTMA